MRILFVLIIFQVFTLRAYAQFGINGKFLTNDASDIDIRFTDIEGRDVGVLDLGEGFSLGIDYWFRLPNKRIEFLPELNFASIENETTAYQFENRIFSLYFNTNIYFLDLESDCDCPTFSKQNDILQKGLFLNVSPGLSFYSSDLNLADQNYHSNDTVFSIGAGLGLDIGISDLVTVSPIVGIRYFPSVAWALNIENFSSPVTQLNAGIRVGFRLDEKRW